MKYFLIAGEASGDLHAAALIREIKARDNTAEFAFYGGDKMREAAGGNGLLKHYKELAYMGFIQVALHLKTILDGMKECKRQILDFQPDCVILVDYAGFNLRIAEYVHEDELCPVFYYISPKVWAWNEGRVKKIRKYVDRLFSILPFEVDYFKKRHNFNVTYVGNPTRDEVAAYLAQHSIQREDVIALLPGSRTSEIKYNLPVMLDAVAGYTTKYKVCIAKAPSQPASLYEGLVAKSGWHFKPQLVEQSFELLTRATAALVTSGTATLETALFNVPQVVCFKMAGGKAINFLRPYFLKCPYISLPNLICNHEIIPELIAAEMTAENAKKELAAILPDGFNRQKQLDGYQALRQLLGDGNAPANCADEIVKTLISIS